VYPPQTEEEERAHIEAALKAQGRTSPSEDDDDDIDEKKVDPTDANVTLNVV